MSELASPNCPYVLSQDARLLFQNWGEKEGVIIPTRPFFDYHTDKLAQQLESTVGSVELVSDIELIEGMQQILSANQSPIISLDRIYGSNGLNIFAYIDSTRAVAPDLTDLGRFNRNGASDVSDQIKAVAARLRELGKTEIQFWDDVIFHGGSIIELAEQFGVEGINVNRVVCGIAVGQGVEEINKLGIPVGYVREYKDLYDEVCERDFVPGVEYGGRLVVNQETGAVLRAPYILPFGDVVKWGSIPVEAASEFSHYCIEQAIIIWTQLNSMNGREFEGDDLPQKIVGMPERVSIVKFLKDQLNGN